MLIKCEKNKHRRMIIIVLENLYHRYEQIPSTDDDRLKPAQLHHFTVVATILAIRETEDIYFKSP